MKTVIHVTARLVQSLSHTSKLRRLARISFAGFLAWGLANSIVRAQDGYLFTTIAGHAGVTGSNNGAGANARFNSPQAVAVDTSGNVYVADTRNLTIRKITDGTVSTLAGQPGLSGTADGSSGNARFGRITQSPDGTSAVFGPAGLAVGLDGSVYVADTDNNTVRRILPAGNVTTFAGTPQGGPIAYVDGTGTGALFYTPLGMAFDPQGTLFVSDTFAHTIRKITPGTAVTTYSGQLNNQGHQEGDRLNATYISPTGVAVDPGGNVFIIDSGNGTIRKIGAGGTVTTIAGSPGNKGSSDGIGAAASFGKITSFSVSDSLYVAYGLGPNGLAIDSTGNLYVADTWNHTIRKVAPNGEVTTIAGSAGAQGSTDGVGPAARFATPFGVAVDNDGNIYVADTGNHTIRKGVAGFKPQIRTHPQNTWAIFGQSATFTAEATGTPAPTFLWLKNGVSIPNETGATLTLTNIQNGDAGSYSVQVSNPFGSVTSTAATLSLGTPPAVTKQPAAQTVASGQTLTLTAEISGTPAPGIQWRKDGVAIPGAVAATLTIASVQLSDAGSYLAVVTNPLGAVTTSTAIVNVTTRPSFTTQPLSQSAAPGLPVTLTVAAMGVPAPTIAWTKNGVAVPGAIAPTLSLASVQPPDTGLYVALLDSIGGTNSSRPAIVGIASTSKVIGTGSEVGSNIVHPNGNTFDQVLLEGLAASVTADSALNQILRISYIDLNNDIVQVEFAGPGTLSLVLDAASGPAAPVNYNQSVNYMKGHAGIVITGANETSNLSVFSVGRANAVNQALFRDDVTYDGFADIAFVAITSANGKFGGVRTANTSYFAARGFTGIYAPGVQFSGPVFIGDINASDSATPVLVIGSASEVRITGGDLQQSNNRAIDVSGFTQIRFADGSTSHGAILPAGLNKARFEQNGLDITSQITIITGP